MTPQRARPPVLSDLELKGVLARAREEGWAELALLAHAKTKLAGNMVRDGWSPSRLFFVADLSLQRAQDIASIATLTSLVISSLPHHALDACWQLRDRGAQILAGLTSLTALRLDYNDIGPEGARAIATLPNLTTLDLDGNVLGPDGPRALAALQGLTSLRLGANQIGPDGAQALAALQGLTSLHLHTNLIWDDGARPLASLANLTVLDLGNNGIGFEGARALATLTNLTSLNLEQLYVKALFGAEGARALASLSNLTSLDLGGNDIGDEGARALAPLSNLTSLDLGGNDIGDEGARALASLSNLTSLNLGGNDIGDEGARALASLSNLTSLNLGGSHLEGRGAQALASLSNLASLDLDRNAIGDDGARALASLPNLTSLALAKNALRSGGARALATLPRLTSLRLDDNAIGDDGARALAALTDLTSLHLARNGIGNDGARALASLPNLVVLDLVANAVTESSIFRPMARLERLNLSANPIGDAPLASVLWGECWAALTAYWHDLDQGEVLNDTVTVLLIGGSRVGKTTLAYALAHGHPPPQPIGDRMQGPLLQCFELALPRGDRVAVHLIDCGSVANQTWHHANGVRSPVFVLLWAKGTHPVPEEWHEHLASLPAGVAVADAGVLLVETRIDEASEPSSPTDHDERDRGGVPRVAVSATTGQGMDQLHAALARVIEGVRPHWAYPIPASWRAVRTTLGAWRDPAAHGLDEPPLGKITSERFAALCATNGIASSEEVASFLYATRFLLHRPRGRQPLVLDPRGSGPDDSRKSCANEPMLDATASRDRLRFPVLASPAVTDALARAREERWTQLALVDSAAAGALERAGWPPSRIIVVGAQPAIDRAPDIASIVALESLVLHGDDDFGLRWEPEHYNQRAEALACLASLTNLTTLDLDGSLVGPEGARALASLTNLTTLRLQWGTIGNAGLRALAALTNLTTLDLSENRIDDDGASALAALTNLTTLHLEGNEIRADGARALTALTNLTTLAIDGQIGADGIRVLEALPRLTSLRLRGPGFQGLGIRPDGIRAIASLSRLTSLHLCHDALGDEGASTLATLVGLTHLRLEYDEIGDEGARALASLEHLTSLGLAGNKVGDDGAKALASLEHLTSLDLRGNKVGDDGAKALASLEHLTSLGLAGNKVGDDGAKALASLEHLTSLDLRGNDIGDEGARALASLQGLTSLRLGGNEFGQPGVEALASLQGLTSLDLGHNQLGDDGARALASLTNLVALDLDHNQLSAAGANALVSLTNLIALDLDGNHIGDDGARVLASLTSLDTLHLDKNHIGDDGARALASLPHLTALHLESNAVTDVSIFRAMPRLESLHLWRNPLRNPFKGIVGMKNCLAALTTYWRDLDRGATTNDTVTVLLVGNPGVGKTTLAHCLAYGHAPAKPVGGRRHEPRLHCSQLVLPGGERIEIRLREHDPDDPEDRSFTAADHLSIILLLWADKTHDALGNWYSSMDVGPAAKDHRVLLVETRIDQSNRRASSQDHGPPELRAAPQVAVSAATGHGLDELRVAIAQVIESARHHWAYPMPTSWRAVRATLDAWRHPAAHGLDAAPVEQITRKQLHELCSTHGITDPEGVRGYLFDAKVLCWSAPKLDQMILQDD